MIRIARPVAVPSALGAGVAATATMRAAIAAEPAKAGRPPATFEFDRDTYAHITVKNALWSAQHDKCAYCEGTFRAFGYGDVEHYRPKAYSQQSKGAKKVYPGYWWLAYSWDNLVVSCDICNRARKRNLFPLRNPAMRAKDEAGVAREEPLLIDPAGLSDPRDHIRFRGAAPEARTDEGSKSIEIYYLDRPYLTAERNKHLREVDRLVKIVAIAARVSDAELAEAAREASDELRALAAPAAEFSAMTRDRLGL